MRITLGVLDVPYNERSSFQRVGRRKRDIPKKLRSTSMTTGRLADILEARYGITQFFLDAHGEEVIGNILEAHAENLARPKTGVGSRTDHLKKALADGEARFRKMLMDREMDGAVEGVPTAAAEIGRRTGRSRRPGRPSFVDTGLYRDSFRMDAEEE